MSNTYTNRSLFIVGGLMLLLLFGCTGNYQKPSGSPQKLGSSGPGASPPSISAPSLGDVDISPTELNDSDLISDVPIVGPDDIDVVGSPTDGDPISADDSLIEQSN
ncbi:hypothetical protein HZC07_03015 [Candidatus Micrarchaeota archaeon]|nr:hypothetical protein [Candidatus Micrarchaeota archaeon]